MIEEMLNRNDTKPEIAGALGCSVPTLNRFLDRHNLEVVTVKGLVPAEFVGRFRPVISWVPVEVPAVVPAEAAAEGGDQAGLPSGTALGAGTGTAPALAFTG